MHAVPDMEPVELDEFPPAVLADWIVADLRRQPATQPEPEPVAEADEPAAGPEPDAAGQLTFDT